MAWSLNVDKEKFKKSEAFGQLHKFIQQAGDAGLITRQELVSMIPPLLLDVQESDLVLDMCAAPGSKTSQMMEAQGVKATGAIIANDADIKRAEMLIHQVQRINSGGILVINHNGQFLPTLEKNNERFLYDKILADVPCTGDGAVRKLPVKWEKWHTNDGLGIHSLQIQILLRALALCKVGGYVLYSTCSINPVEDEAVITEMFNRLNDDSIELIDVHQKLPGFKGRKGLTHWPILQLLPDIFQKYPKLTEVPEEPLFTVKKLFQEFQTYDEYLQKRHFYQKHIVSQSMFPKSEEFMNKIKIQNTMRVMPQDQNTGGFYLALIRKKAPIYLQKRDECESNKERKMETQVQHIANLGVLNQEQIENMVREKQNAQKQRENHQEKTIQEVVDGSSTSKKTKQQFKIVDEQEFEIIKKFFGLNNLCDRSQFISNIDGPKKILVVSKGVAKLLEADQKNQISKINMGAKAFSKVKLNFGKDQECHYRICQDGALIMIQYMDKQIFQIRRKIQVSYAQFIQLLTKETYEREEVSPEMQKLLAQEGFGSMIVYVDEVQNGIKILDAICINNFFKNFNVMISKELVESYKIRYLY